MADSAATKGTTRSVDAAFDVPADEVENEFDFSALRQNLVWAHTSQTNEELRMPDGFAATCTDNVGAMVAVEEVHLVY